MGECAHLAGYDHKKGSPLDFSHFLLKNLFIKTTFSQNQIFSILFIFMEIGGAIVPLAIKVKNLFLKNLRKLQIAYLPLAATLGTLILTDP